MQLAFNTVTYFLLFIALYFEIFLLITYFEHKEKREKRKEAPSWDKLPSVSILVPCWNEGSTLIATVESILNLNYPKEKLSIFLVDDGSTDNTWENMQVFALNSQVKLLQKENGGKHTALNYALQFVNSDLVGCLDADSFVEKDALLKIVAEFEDKELMAVTPSIKVHQPKNILELIQKVEYGWGVMLRNLMASLGALYITPGPFSIFKKEVFDKLGGYRKAHNTEDMEIAVRMQKAGMKIGNAYDAFILTTAPKNLKALFKQRLRWSYGFIKNAMENRDIYFNPKYGNLGVIVFPTATLSLFSSVFLLFVKFQGWISQAFNKSQELLTVGWNSNWNFAFDPFYLDTTVIRFVSIVSIMIAIYMLFLSRKMAEGRMKPGFDVLLFLGLYVFIAPFWMGKALYNAVFSKATTWR